MQGREARGAALWALWALWALAGCQAVATLKTPPLDGARSALLLVQGEAGEVIHALSLEPLEPSGAEDERSLRLPEALLEGQPQVHLLLFGCSLEQMGLSEGQQPLLDEPLPSPVIGRPFMLYRTALEPELAWEPLGALEQLELSAGALLRRLDLSPERLCAQARAEFRASRITVDLLGPGKLSRFARPLKDGSVLVGGPQGELFVVSPKGEARTLPRLTGVVNSDAYMDPEGALWLLTEGGQLAKGDLSEVTLTSVSPAMRERSGGTGVWARLVGPTKSAPLELFVVADESSFERFDGQGWRTLSEGRERPRAAEALWIGPGEALSGGGGSSANVLVRYKDGVVIEEPLPTQRAVLALTDSPGLGTYAGTQGGELFRLGEAGWKPVVSSALPAQILALAPMEGGALVLAGADERFPAPPVLGQALGDRFCPMEPLSEQLPYLVAPMGEGRYLLVEYTEASGALDLIILEQQRPPARCSVTP